MADQALAGNDLVAVRRCAGFLETLGGRLLTLAGNVLNLLQTSLLVANLTGLELVVLECA